MCEELAVRAKLICASANNGPRRCCTLPIVGALTHLRRDDCVYCIDNSCDNCGALFCVLVLLQDASIRPLVSLILGSVYSFWSAYIGSMNHAGSRLVLQSGPPCYCYALCSFRGVFYPLLWMSGTWVIFPLLVVLHPIRLVMDPDWTWGAL